MKLTLLVPKVGTVPGGLIDSGSGVVADLFPATVANDQLPPGRIQVYYEGNRFGQYPDWQERVRHAADRLATKYPTIARGVFRLDEFEQVGTYYYGPHRFQLTNVVLLAQWCGHHPVDRRLNPSIYKQRVPCLDCPFRKDDGGARHGHGRAAEYISHFLSPPGATFPCHKSVPDLDPRTKWSDWQDGQVLCSGGLLFGAKHNIYNGVAALGMACGWYDPADHTDEERSLVFDTISDMLKAYDEAK